MTVNCCWLLSNFELKFCTKLILRIIPRIIGPITIHLVSAFNQCRVHCRGDAQMKNATKILASSTKMRKSFATFGNKLYPLWFLRCRKVDNACLKSARFLTGIVSEPTVFERIHQLFRHTRISSGVMWCVCLGSLICPSHDILLHCGQRQTCSCGTSHRG